MSDTEDDLMFIYDEVMEERLLSLRKLPDVDDVDVASLAKRFKCLIDLSVLSIPHYKSIFLDM